MASKKTAVANPVTFELPLTLIDKIEQARAKRGLKSVSEVIRVALDRAHVKHDAPLGQAREAAFFPPMTGG